MDEYIVIRYHHGGLLVRNDKGKVTYVNGRVDDLPKMDADYVNLRDLDTLFKGFGYEKCKQMWWLKPTESDLEVGLNLLEKDSDVLDMVKAALSNGNKISIYFEDCIAIPDILASPAERSPLESADEEGVLGDSVGSSCEFNSFSAFSADESEEGEGNGLSYDSYDSVEDDPYKPPPPSVDDETKDELDEEEEPIIALKKKVKGKKEKKAVNKSDREENLEEDEENMSFEDQGYGYNSEELKTPLSSGDEEVEREVFPKFNEEQTFGQVQLELGMEFGSLEHFKQGVKDYNISLGRQFVWVKNDKVRSRAKCSNADSEWLIYCSWSNKFNCFQVKTFNDNHT